MPELRYLRQQVLPEIGEAGQLAIERARILCVGLGGLGAPAALYLAAAGVGRLGLMDGDRVEPSNLPRQVLYGDSDVGELKAVASRHRLRELGAWGELVALPFDFSELNAAETLAGYDVVIDGTDSLPAKLLLNDTALQLGIPLVHGSVSGFEAQLAVIRKGQGGCYRCLYPRPAQAGPRDCARDGVLGPFAGALASLQALAALKLVIGLAVPGSSLAPTAGELIRLDGRSLSMQRLRIPARPGCVCLGGAAPRVLTPVALAPDAEVQELSVAELEQAAGRYRLLDVRSDEEREADPMSHERSSSHWPLSRLERGQLPEPPVEPGAWACFCASGLRARRAAELLRRHGQGQARFIRLGILSVQFSHRHTCFQGEYGPVPI